MMKRIGSYILTLLFFALSILSYTQEIETRVSKNTIAKNELFRVDFIAKKNCKFDYPDLSDFEVLRGPDQSTQQSVTMINGQVQKEFTITHSFVLRPKRTGSFIINPCVLKCDDKNHQSKAIRLKIVEGSQQQNTKTENQNWFGRVQTNKSSAYVGEPILATYKIYSRYSIADLSELNFGDGKGWYKKEIDPKTNLQIDQETYNGMRYYMVELKKDLLFAQYSGDLEAPSFSIEAYFRKSFFKSYKDNITSNQSSIKVKPLPTKNKPTDFSGAVGKFDYNVQLSKNTLEVGEAIDLTIVLDGLGNLGLFTPKKPELPETFEIYDPEIDENTKITTRGIKGKITYNYLMVPQRPGKFEIPALTFSYFDPKTSEYVTITTDPFEIEVEGDLTATNPTNYKPNQKEIDAKPTFRHISKNNFDPILKTDLIYNTPLFWALTSIPISLSILLIFLNLKRKNPLEKKETSERIVKRRMKKAFQLLKSQDYPQFYGEVLNTIYGFLKEKLDIEGVDMNKSTIQEKLNTINEHQLADQICELLEEIEMAQYAGISKKDKAEDIAKNTRNILSEIAQKWKNK